MEVWGNNRSVMPLDVLGRTRATLMKSTSLQPWPEGLGNLLKLHRAGDRSIAIIDLQRGIPSKRESSACVDYVPALCTHRPSLLPIEWFSEIFGLESGSWQQQLDCWEVDQTWSFRGSKSRNKVSVGEPAEGSLTNHNSSLWHSCVKNLISTLCAHVCVGTM